MFKVLLNFKSFNFRIIIHQFKSHVTNEQLKESIIQYMPSFNRILNDETYILEIFDEDFDEYIHLNKKRLIPNLSRLRLRSTSLQDDTFLYELLNGTEKWPYFINEHIPMYKPVNEDTIRTTSIAPSHFKLDDPQLTVKLIELVIASAERLNNNPNLVWTEIGNSFGMKMIDCKELYLSMVKQYIITLSTCRSMKEACETWPLFEHFHEADCQKAFTCIDASTADQIVNYKNSFDNQIGEVIKSLSNGSPESAKSKRITTFSEVRKANLLSTMKAMIFDSKSLENLWIYVSQRMRKNKLLINENQTDLVECLDIFSVMFKDYIHTLETCHSLEETDNCAQFRVLHTFKLLDIYCSKEEKTKLKLARNLFAEKCKTRTVDKRIKLKTRSNEQLCKLEPIGGTLDIETVHLNDESNQNTTDKYKLADLETIEIPCKYNLEKDLLNPKESSVKHLETIILDTHNKSVESIIFINLIWESKTDNFSWDTITRKMMKMNFNSDNYNTAEACRKSFHLLVFDYLKLLEEYNRGNDATISWPFFELFHSQLDLENLCNPEIYSMIKNVKTSHDVAQDNLYTINYPMLPKKINNVS